MHRRSEKTTGPKGTSENPEHYHRVPRLSGASKKGNCADAGDIRKASDYTIASDMSCARIGDLSGRKRSVLNGNHGDDASARKKGEMLGVRTTREDRQQRIKNRPNRSNRPNRPQRPQRIQRIDRDTPSDRKPQPPHIHAGHRPNLVLASKDRAEINKHSLVRHH